MSNSERPSLTDEQCERIEANVPGNWEVSRETFKEERIDYETRVKHTYGYLFHRGDPIEGTYQMVYFERNGADKYYVGYQSMYQGWDIDTNEYGTAETFKEGWDIAREKMREWEPHSPIPYADKFRDAEYAEDLGQITEEIPEDERDYRHKAYIQYLMRMLPYKSIPNNVGPGWLG